MHPWRRLGPGQIFLDYGPIQMMIQVHCKTQNSTALAEAGAQFITDAFPVLCSELPLARQRIDTITASPKSPILRRMLAAARCAGERNATPMLAVAGSIAQEACDFIRQAGGERIIINNGGDIALYNAGNDAITVGVLNDLKTGTLLCSKPLYRQDCIGGVATSGLGGRSMTRGIASSAVVFSKDAATADACATILANATYVPDPRIHQVPAGTLDPNTDIPDLMVTSSVDPLPRRIVTRSLLQAGALAEQYLQQGHIRGAVIAVQSHSLSVPEHFCTPQKGGFLR